MQFGKPSHHGVDTVVLGLHPENRFGFIANLISPVIDRSHTRNNGIVSVF
jgi:hypothetical protein